MKSILKPGYKFGYREHSWIGVRIILAALLFGLFSLAQAEVNNGASATIPDLEMFVREGCAHCEEAERFVARLCQERPALQVTIRDIFKDAGALERLRDLAAGHGETALGVPSFYLRGELLVGFSGDAVTGARIQSLLDRPRDASAAGASLPASPTAVTDHFSRACTASDDPACKSARGSTGAITVPWLNISITVEDLGLPLFTAIIGLLDGLNPCSMWVLVMMISMLAAIGDRKKMLAIAGTFIIIEGIAYFAFMAAWLNLFLLVGVSRASEVVIGVIALIAGLINVKDFAAFGRGITLSIPAAAKPGIYNRIRKVLHEKSMAMAIAGTVVLAILVQLVELLCTSGFPALYTRILTLHHLDPWTYYGYLLLYNVMYMFDDAVILGIGVITLSRHRLQENEGRWLKLLSGAVMLLLGLYLIAAPH